MPNFITYWIALMLIRHNTAQNCSNLLAPKYGNMSCKEWSKGKKCDVTCDPTHDVAPSSFMMTSFLCDKATGRWNSERIPKCSERSYPDKVDMNAKYFFSGQCDAMKDEINRLFYIAILKAFNCTRQDRACPFRNMFVLCGDGEPQGTSNSTQNAKTHRISFTKDAILSRKRRQHISVRLSRKVLSFGEDIDKTMRAYKMDLLHDAQRLSRVSFTVRGRVTRISRARIPQPYYTCPPAFVTGIFHRDTCVQCPEGSFHEKVKCKACPVGEYQDSKGQRSCAKCPPGRTTVESASVAKTACQKICPEGKYSQTGVRPCQPCPKGTFQNKENAKSCQQCPFDLTTEELGSQSWRDCKCDDGAWFYRGRCFKIVIFRRYLSWLRARVECHRNGYVLASIRDSSTEEFLLSKLKSFRQVYIGLRKDFPKARGLYSQNFRWDDNSPMMYSNWRHLQPNGGSIQRCSYMGAHGWQDTYCNQRATNTFICMKKLASYEKTIARQVPNLPPTNEGVSEMFVNCSNNELVSRRKICDGQRDCVDGSDELGCGKNCSDDRYGCKNGRCVSYAYYCDGIDDCGDQSDEIYCELRPCGENMWTCKNGQCIDEDLRCDLHADCIDMSDELFCDICREFQCRNGKCIANERVDDGIVDCDGEGGEDEDGLYRQQLYNWTRPIKTDPEVACVQLPGKDERITLLLPQDGDCRGKIIRIPEQGRVQCPSPYYKCPGSFCLAPLFVCNGISDCQDGEDEVKCDQFSCPGYYRCINSNICISPSELCDKFRHCPSGDDERSCEQDECPSECECHDRVVVCDKVFNTNTSFALSPDVRKLNVSGVNLGSNDAGLAKKELNYLATLILSRCNLSCIGDLIVGFPNLIILDLSHNQITNISSDSFIHVPRLLFLDLSNNPDLQYVDTSAFDSLKKLVFLNLENTNLGNVDVSLFLGLEDLYSLVLTNIHMTELTDELFWNLSTVKFLDIRQNHIRQFGSNLQKGLKSIQKLFVDSYQVCCEYLRPDTLSEEDCVSTKNAISSCNDLLAAAVLRGILWTIAIIAFFGNLFVITYRCFYDGQSKTRSYGIFVTNLSMSDCLMGIYMIVIGITDIYYRGVYVANDFQWRHSGICKLAGFLSTLSTEASCLMIALITLDRFLAIKFPFRQVKFSRRTALACVCLTWILAFGMAVVPLLPEFRHWSFYSQNSVCLALPLSHHKSPGWAYSSGIFIGFNFVLFILIGLGQIFIYRSIKASSKIRKGGSSSSERVVARRLFLVVFTDFLCWFPVCIMGVMAACGVFIGKNVFAWTAVTVLPINSALNPVLYTLPSIIHAWKSPKKGFTLDVSDRRSTKTQGLIIPWDIFPNIKTYVGTPTCDMVTLDVALQSRDLSAKMKCDLIGLVIAYVHDLENQNRIFEPITDQRVFVSHFNDTVEALCLSLEPDPSRDDLTEDIFYLTRLLSRWDRDLSQDEKL